MSFGKLGSIESYQDSIGKGIKIKNKPPKGARGFYDVHYPIQAVVRYTSASIDAGVPGFEIQIRFGDNDYWRDIDSPNRRNLRGLKRALSKDPGFSEEEITEKH